eukprot:gene6758-10923_t
MSAKPFSSKKTNVKSTPKTNSLSKRLQSELMSLMMSKTPGISAFPEGDNMMCWTASIQGIEDTPYADQTYKLSIKFPDNYPFSAPKVCFTHVIYHPNVDTSGNICLDILKEKWSAVYNVRTILLSIQSLLGEPNNESPLNAQAAMLWDNQTGWVVDVEKVRITPNKLLEKTKLFNLGEHFGPETVHVDPTGNYIVTLTAKNILKINIKTKEINKFSRSNWKKIIMKNLQFANGITLSKNDDYFLVVETGKYKILKYWLKGENKGKTEVFAFCPGFCDNISVSQDRKTFWVGVPTARSDFYDTIHNVPWIKKFMLSLPPSFLSLSDDGLIIQLDEQGNMIKVLNDKEGNTIRNINSVNEYEGKLYLGNVKSNKFGIYDLTN